jgi:DNA topoisomerase IA
MYKILVMQKTKNIEQNLDKTEEKQIKRQKILKKIDKQVASIVDPQKTSMSNVSIYFNVIYSLTFLVRIVTFCRSFVTSL